MIALQDAGAEPVRGFLRGALRGRQVGLRGRFRDFVGVVGAVERGEAFQVGGGPGVLALEEFVDFALRGAALGDGGCVGVFGGLEGGAGGGYLGFWG